MTQKLHLDGMDLIHFSKAMPCGPGLDACLQVSRKGCCLKRHRDGRRVGIDGGKES